MAITFNITLPVTDEEVDLAIHFLSDLGGYADTPATPSAESTLLVDTGNFNDGDLTVIEPETPPAEAGTLAKSSTGTKIPWDERIHSAGKTINADGSWRLKRGVDDAAREAVESELFRASCAWRPTEGGIQSQATGEATPPPGAVEALNATQAIAPPPPPVPAPGVEVRYKHGDQTFTREDLLAAKWNEEQISRLETVEVAKPAPIATAATPAQTDRAPMNFAEVAMRISAEGLDIASVINPMVVELAASLGKTTVNQFALCATPTNADVLAALAARLWPEG